MSESIRGSKLLGDPTRRLVLTADDHALLGAAADGMVPGDARFPAPSSTRLFAYIERYLAREPGRPPLYPHLEWNALGTALRSHREGLLGAGSERAGALASLEREQPELFERFRALVYYAYYAQPEVVEAIRAHIPAAADYHGPPQPSGYEQELDDWPADAFDRVVGDYTRTGEVRRIGRSGEAS